ncbi:hypothetical protein GCM10020255_001540 [Rhodococcus baikonurensis]
MHGINDIEWEEYSVVGTAALGNWAIAIARMAWAGSDDELMVPLSVGREVLTHSRDVEAVSSFDLWQDGVHTVQFDPLRFRSGEPDVGGVEVADEGSRARPRQ